MKTIGAVLKHHFRQADRLMLCILWCLCAMALALSGLHDTLRWALLIGIPTALVPTALIVFHGRIGLTASVVAAALMVFSALHIHQAAGINELHSAFLCCWHFCCATATGSSSSSAPP